MITSIARIRCCARASRLRLSGGSALSRYGSTVASVSSTHQTPVGKIVRDSIKATGPVSISTYMQLCLSHPIHGYYMNPENPIFGKEGDFITSPEISQIFGELIAIWHLSRWESAGRPSRIRIVELGPGRGTLIADALRTFAQFPAVRDALAPRNGGEVLLVETSEALRKLQGETLRGSRVLERFAGEGRSEQEKEFVRWFGSFEEMNEESTVDKNTFTMVVAHEFFDALPVHVIEKGQYGWHELQIITSPSRTSNPNLRPSLSPISEREPFEPQPLRLIRDPEPSTYSNFLGSISSRYASLPAGTRVEVSPISYKIALGLARIINDPNSAGGSALIVDYGRDGISGNSLRAFKNHKIVDIFEKPGECDLTANVDFALLKEAISGTATAHGPITQRDFLLDMGINLRVSALQNSQKTQTDDKDPNPDSERIIAISRAAQRLVDKTGMGIQYKVLGITGSGAGMIAEEKEKGCYPFDVERSIEMETVKGVCYVVHSA